MENTAMSAPEIEKALAEPPQALVAITRIVEEAEAGACICYCTIDYGVLGVETDVPYSFAEDDPFPTAFRDQVVAWLANPENVYGREPYTPPTAEQIRAQLPKLTARRLRLGLIKAGYSLSQVQAALEAMPEGQARDEALVEWEYASEYERLHPLLAQIGAVLGIDDEKIDRMWQASAAL